ncbi:MAG: vitamin K epoxide reductase family protein [Candidatus Gracilibacteria bacterium]|nr:vitamin K epoxide reductase family protein [Candidatus Gracilibacteria bacterium]
MKKLFIAIMTLAIIAFGNAIYLTNQAYTLKTKLAESTGSYSTFCDINSTFSCSNVLISPRAQFFGYPFPALAMLVYPVIFLIALLGYIGICRKSFSILAGMALVGICFNGYYIYQEAFYIGSYCPLCLMCSGIIILILGISIFGIKKSKT